MNLRVITGREDVEARGLRALHRSGAADLRVYLIHEAVACWETVANDPPPGLKLYVCAYNLEIRGLPLPPAGSAAVPCGIAMLGRLLEAEDAAGPVLISHGPREEAAREARRVADGLRNMSRLTVETGSRPGSVPDKENKESAPFRRIDFQ